MHSHLTIDPSNLYKYFSWVLRSTLPLRTLIFRTTIKVFVDWNRLEYALTVLSLPAYAGVYVLALLVWEAEATVEPWR